MLDKTDLENKESFKIQVTFERKLYNYYIIKFKDS